MTDPVGPAGASAVSPTPLLLHNSSYKVVSQAKLFSFHCADRFLYQTIWRVEARYWKRGAEERIREGLDWLQSRSLLANASYILIFVDWTVVCHACWYHYNEDEVPIRSTSYLVQSYILDCKSLANGKLNTINYFLLHLWFKHGQTVELACCKTSAICCSLCRCSHVV